ncbi:globin [Sphingobacterium cellulitidis]|uniref:group III truncated hemoglobin n=1 Tax=Sphingobacterium cellulitidis TaxID=1768011 RepID=UPI000B93D728|nr:group III truncated hemoglobin [Sphingobacterium cellulitidis]OYD44253.1 globin [Sphingobacterium cellulitidis]
MENQKRDIQNMDDIKAVVNEFYGYIREDELLGPIFNGIIQDRWAEHLEKMYRFWQTVLLEEHTYYGSPFPPHAKLPVEKRHFDQWLALFSRTVDNLFAGEKAERAKWQGARMAEMFQYKIEYYQNNNLKPLI